MKNTKMPTDYIEIVGDLHTHSVASGHAYSTVLEIVNYASKKGLEIVGITDHGPGTPGAPSYSYFENITTIPEKIGNLTILRGVEANILSISGKLDIPESIAENLDIVLAGFHVDTFTPNSSIEVNTSAVLAAMDNSNLDCISHPCNPAYPIDYEAFVKKAVEKNILIEVNNSSLREEMRPGSQKNCREIIKLAKKWKANLIISSDAHCFNEVGIFDKCLELLNEECVEEELILNTSSSKIEKFLVKKGKKRYCGNKNNI